MFDVFKNYISARAALSDRELELLQSASILKLVRRKEYLLKEGEVAQAYGFVTKGCLRFYRIGDDKTEHILRFAIENWWMTDVESLEQQAPSKCYIQALENSEILQWPKAELERLKKEIPAFGAALERLTAKFQHTTLDRVYSALSLTPEQRYEKFLATYPDIFNRVPLHMIASYLGISRKTLTRIRTH